LKKILLVPIFVVLIAVLSCLPQDAHAATTIDLKDKTSCQAAPLSGSWNATTSTCTIGNFTLNHGDSLTLDNSIFPNIFLTINGTLTNNGTITNIGYIINSGTINNLSGGTINNNNSGVIRNLSFVINYGTITNNSFGQITNIGTITNNSGGTITNNNTLNNYGTITNNSGGTIANNSFMSNLGTTTNFGTINNLNAIRNYGTITNNSGGTINSSDSIVNFSGGTITNNSGGTINNSFGNITNFGTINNNAGAKINNSGTIDNRCGGITNNSGIISGNPIVNSCTTTTLIADKDSYIIQDSPNVNQGSNSLLKVQQLRVMRSLVSFDLSPYESKHVSNAQLRLYPVGNGYNWGSGDTIEAHKLTTGWTEGNGFNATRGTGSGTTWNCAIDANITNSFANCKEHWNGGSFVASPTSSTLIVNNIKNILIGFNVTSDVNSFLDGNSTDNFGWIIKKTNENNSGSIWFASREYSNASFRPQLVITLSP